MTYLSKIVTINIVCLPCNRLSPSCTLSFQFLQEHISIPADFQSCAH